MLGFFRVKPGISPTYGLAAVAPNRSRRCEKSGHGRPFWCLRRVEAARRLKLCCAAIMDDRDSKPSESLLR
jgi:hypothetical protein